MPHLDDDDGEEALPVSYPEVGDDFRRRNTQAY